MLKASWPYINNHRPTTHNGLLDTYIQFHGDCWSKKKLSFFFFGFSTSFVSVIGDGCFIRYLGWKLRKSQKDLGFKGKNWYYCKISIILFLPRHDNIYGLYIQKINNPFYSSWIDRQMFPSMKFWSISLTRALGTVVHCDFFWLLLNSSTVNVLKSSREKSPQKNLDLIFSIFVLLYQNIYHIYPGKSLPIVNCKDVGKDCDKDCQQDCY